MILPKNVLNKSCSELNFPQKTQWNHVSISGRSGAKGLQGLPFWKYYNALEWESRFTLGLNVASNTDLIKNFFKLSCSELNFLQKTY